MVGLIGAIEFVEEPSTNKRFSPELKVTPRIIEELHERGVICRGVTYDGTDIVCFSPPLSINKEEIEILVNRLRESVLAVQGELESQLEKA